MLFCHTYSFLDLKKMDILKTAFLRELPPKMCFYKHLNYISCRVEQIGFLFINIKEAENKLNPEWIKQT